MRGSLRAFSNVAAAALLFSSQAVAQDDVIVIDDFETLPVKPWASMNDSDFGGESTATVNHFNVEDGDSYGLFQGTVVEKSDDESAAGFVAMVYEGGFPDISNCEGIRVTARSEQPYDGYFISIGRIKYRNNMRGHKAPFQVGTSSYQTVDISFSKFNDYWKRATGESYLMCSTSHPLYCPNKDALASVGHMAIWAESAGDVRLEVKSIKAYDCATKTDGDLFKTMLDMFSEKEQGGGSNKKSVTTTTTAQEDTITAIENKIALPVAVAALFVSLLALFSVWRMGRKASGDRSSATNDSKPELEKKPGDELL